MTLIRVNPESVRGYGAQAQATFDEITTALEQLTREVVAVRYFGPNAVSFKTECGRIAADFGNRLHQDMAAMAEAVRRSTSNIAASLGGAPICITMVGQAIIPPTPLAVDYVDVDTDALDALVPVVAGRFTSVRGGLSLNFGRLQQTDWEGNAKLAAVDAVGGFTNSARHRCDQAEHALTSYVRSQIHSVLAADR